MCCFFLLGSYFCYDIPGVLEKEVETEFGVSATQWSLLYTVYSMPNMVLPFFGGLMLDSIGYEVGLIVFTTVLTIGQLVCWIGCMSTKYWVLLMGRVIFGLGGESMSVAQSAFVSIWFKGKELAFAFGVNISVARLGSVIQAASVPPLYEAGGLPLPMLVGLIICVFSLVNAFGMVFLERADKKIMGKAQVKDEKKGAETAEKKNDEEAFKLSDLKTFRLPFWLLTISCVATYMSIFPYIQICSDLMQKKYSLDSIQAGHLFGIPYIISAILSPILGFGIDKVGRRALFVTLSSAVLIVAFVISALLPSEPGSRMEVIPLVLVGSAYSVYCSAIWGSIPYAVEPRTVGTAYGICTAVQNIGLVIAPTVVGVIKEKTADKDFGYFWV